MPLMRRLLLLCLIAAPLRAQDGVPAAIYTDPPRDSLHPPRMEVLHIPSGDVRINGVAYLASGAGVHPTLVLLHGLPGNEKNLDLAQAVRRAGWNVVTFNYRGSWGSPGSFRFANTVDDADAVLRYVRDSASSLGVDTTNMVLGGHSMGGWATAISASHQHGLRGAILISAADMGGDAAAPRALLVQGMRGNMETLANTTPARMADELIAKGSRWRLADAGRRTGALPLLVITSNDGLAGDAASYVAGARGAGNTAVTTLHLDTDHGYSGQRIALATAVLRWLGSVRR